jgi:flagellar biosynthesis protein FliQ
MIKLQGLVPCLFASCVRSSSKRRFAIFQSLSRGFVYSALSSFNRFLFSALLQGLFLSILQALLYSPLHSPSRIVSILFKLYCILLFILLQGGLYLSFKHCILSSSISFKECIYPSSIVFSPLQSPSRIVSILQALYSLLFNLLQGLYLSFMLLYSPLHTLLHGLFVSILQALLFSPLHYSPSGIVCMHSSKHHCILLPTLLQGFVLSSLPLLSFNQEVVYIVKQHTSRSEE